MRIILNVLQTGSHEFLQAFSKISEDATELDLSKNELFKRPNAILVNAFTLIPANIIHIDLSFNDFSDTYSASSDNFPPLPSTVISLSLFENQLHKFSVERLKQFKDALPNIEIIHLSKSELAKMSNEQREALKEIFPNITKVRLLNWRGQVSPSSIPDVNCILSLTGRAQEVPSLLNQCAFFIRNNTTFNVKSAPPVFDELKSFINSFFNSEYLTLICPKELDIDPPELEDLVKQRIQVEHLTVFTDEVNVTYTDEVSVRADNDNDEEESEFNQPKMRYS